MLELIEPIQATPDPDLPLLVWTDQQGGIRTSWREDPNGWTPIDIGFSRPGYVMLAHPDRANPVVNDGGTPLDPPARNGEPDVLRRRVPRTTSPELSDAEIIDALSHRRGDFLKAWPDVIDSLFLAIHEPLRAAVVIGATALRQCRRWEIQRPTPLAAIDQAATLLSYDQTHHMPDRLAELCGWATPDVGNQRESRSAISESRVVGSGFFAV
jgi:hypothetical protein